MKLTNKSPQDILTELYALHPELERAMVEVRATVPPLKREIAPYQAAALYTLAKQYDGGRILEIGTAWGYSAAIMAKAAPKAQIITLNPDPKEVEIARKNLQFYKNVTVETLTSHQYKENYQGAPFDLVFVDGNHKAKFIRHDLLFWEHLAPNGLILCHDYSPSGATEGKGGHGRECVPVYEAVNWFAGEIGKTEPDVLIVDDGLVGMAGFIKPKKKSERRKLAEVTNIISGAHAFSMLSWNHLSELHALAQSIETPGDVVECGCWQGGSACLLWVGARREGMERKLVMFDVLDGIPKPGPEDGDKALNKWQSAHDRGEGWCNVGNGQIGQAAKRLKLPMEAYTLQVGDWTEKPFPEFPDGIAILHVDATLYRSTKKALEGLYDRVNKGGVVLVSAFGHWNGVKRAVEEFRKERSIDAQLYTVDKVNVYWFKG